MTLIPSLSWMRNSQKRKMRMTVMVEVIWSFLTLVSILYKQKMGKKRAKKLRKVNFKHMRKNMMAFLGINYLGINYIMSINQLRTVQSYWECGQFIGDEGIRNTMSKQRSKNILRNLFRTFRIFWIMQRAIRMTKDSRFVDELQSVDNHMVKFKCRSSLKQYVNKKNEVGFQFLV